MRILHVIPSLDPKMGGPSKAVQEMCEYLKKEGVSADIATTHNPKGNPEMNPNVKIYSFPSTLGNYKYSSALNKWLKNNIKNYDLIHIHSIFCYSTLAATRICRKLNKPYIIRTIGQLYDYSLNNKGRMRKRIYLGLFEKDSLRNAAALHFTSQDEKNKIAIDISDKNFILPLGVCPTKKLAKNSIDKKFPYLKGKEYILFLSRLHPKKGLELLIPSISKILLTKDLYLILAGDGEESYLKHVKKLIRENQIENRVIFVGQVAGEEKNLIIQNAKLFILPSYTENFGISVIESMEAGTPVAISRQVGISREIEEYRAGTVFDLNPADIENRIGKTLERDKLRKNFSSRAKKMVKNLYNWKNITKKQIEIYQKIIKK